MEHVRSPTGGGALRGAYGAPDVDILGESCDTQNEEGWPRGFGEVQRDSLGRGPFCFLVASSLLIVGAGSEFTLSGSTQS